MYQEILNSVIEFFLTISTNAIETLVSAIFLLIAIFVFGFNFWRRSRDEGFSSIKIFDLMNIALVSGILGTYIIQRIYFFVFTNYFPLNRESFVVFPVYEVFVILTVIVTYNFCKKYQWSMWKIGDLATFSLALTQFILAMGLVLQSVITNSRNNHLFTNPKLISIDKLVRIEYLVIAISFGLIYYLLRQLNNKTFFSSSANYFFRKRNTSVQMSGYLLATYTFLVSSVMLIFLTYTQNLGTWAWWFQLVFYALTLIFSIIVFIYKLNKSNNS